MKNLKLITIAMATALLIAGCGSKSEDEVDSNSGKSTGTSSVASGVKGTGIISGKVILNGKAPAQAKIDMGADPTCKAQHTETVKEESVVQNADGTLQNVFIYVKSGAGNYSAPTTPVVLEQKGCRYHPHVLGIQVGQTLEIVNSDPTLHNVHCMATVNDAFNLGQPVQGMKSDKTFSKPEIMIKTKCDVHGWMNCYIGVVNNPFFGTTGTDGTFMVTGLPAGTYTLEAWQEKYGTSDQTVTIKDGEIQTVNFTFSSK